MARLRNVTSATLAVYSPPGNSNAVMVPAGETLEVAGEVSDAGDAYLAGSGDNARLYPKAQWALEGGGKPASGGKSPTKKITTNSSAEVEG